MGRAKYHVSQGGILDRRRRRIRAQSRSFYRQHFADRHFACRYRDNLSIAMVGTTGQSTSRITRACVFVERHLAS
jgi:hypothetical protein